MSTRPTKDGTNVVGGGNVLLQACYDGDLEAFLQLADIASSLPEPIKLQSAVRLQQVVSSKSADILDVYIQRTGSGLPVDALSVSPAKENEDEDEAELKARETEQSKRLYLGLSIHGKKRKDLATRGDAHAQDQDTTRVPLLWEIIRAQAGGSDMVDYLYGPRPLAAYRAYASSNTTELAEALQRISDDDLAKILPDIFGLIPNARRETAVTAAIISSTDTLELTKKFLSLSPKHAQDYLHAPCVFLLEVYKLS